MPKYLIKVSYTAEGVKGVLKDGGTKRRQAAEAVVKSTGGRLESMYFAFGDDDVYVIVDAPDNLSVAAAAQIVEMIDRRHSFGDQLNIGRLVPFAPEGLGRKEGGIRFD